MGPVPIHWELSRKLHGNHPVFYVLLLCRYLPGGDRVQLPEPVSTGDADEYKVEALIAHR